MRSRHLSIDGNGLRSYAVVKLMPPTYDHSQEIKRARDGSPVDGNEYYHLVKVDTVRLLFDRRKGDKRASFNLPAIKGNHFNRQPKSL